MIIQWRHQHYVVPESKYSFLLIFIFSLSSCSQIIFLCCRRRWLHRQATNRIAPSDEEPRRKYGRSPRGRPLAQEGLPISGRAPRAIADETTRELAWLNTGNGVQLMSIQPIAPPMANTSTLTPGLPVVSPLHSPSFQQRQLEAYLKVSYLTTILHLV